MAIIPFYPGLKVEILVNDTPLPEYDDIEDTPSPPNSVTKYIEATTGAEFKFRVIVDKAFPFPAGDLAMNIYIDGEYAVGSCIRPKYFYRKTGYVQHPQTSNVDGKVFEQAFIFQELQIAKEEDSGAMVGEEAASIIRELGSITVDFQFGKNLRPDLEQSQEIADMIPTSFPEATLKGRALNHRIGFGKPIAIELAKEKACFFDVDPIGEAPFAYFNFEYRSIDALRTLQIIPPLPSLEERPEEELSNAELQELVKKLKRDAAGRAVQKVPDVKLEEDQETEAEEEDDMAVVEQKKRKRRCGQDGEVIVLD